MEVGNFLRVWDESGSFCDFEVEEEPRVNSAVQRWVDSGRTKDTVLDLTTKGGEPFCVLASTITSWKVSTLEGRVAGVDFDVSLQNEIRGLRESLGAFDE